MAAQPTSNGAPDQATEMASATAELNAAIQGFSAASASTPSGIKDMQAVMAHKKAVVDSARSILRAVMEPTDQYFAWCGELAQMTALRLLWEWGVMDAIPLEGTASYAELAEKTGTEETLLLRIAHVLVANGVLEQTAEGRVGHTRLSRTLVDGNATGLIFSLVLEYSSWENNFVPYARFPEFFQKYGRKEPQTINHVPNTFAYNCPEMGYYEMLVHDPPRMKRFMPAMAAIESRMPIAGIYDFGWLVAEAKAHPDSERPLFVDVGGSKGQAIVAIHREFPDLPLQRFVLEDRPEVIKEVEVINDENLRPVKKIGIDFHKDQPVKGAHVYWIRRCFHNYGDEISVNMLRILAGALVEDSHILIQEDILDNPPNNMAAMLDVMMMSFGGKQRSLATWGKLLDAAGLKINNISKGDGPWRSLGVLDCVKK